MDNKIPSLDDFLRKKIVDYLGASSFEDVPEFIQKLIVDKDSLSQEEQGLVQAGPKVQNHIDAGFVDVLDNWWFVGFEEEDKFNVY